MKHFKLILLFIIVFPNYFMANTTMHSLFSDPIVQQVATEFSVWAWPKEIHTQHKHTLRQAQATFPYYKMELGNPISLGSFDKEYIAINGPLYKSFKSKKGVLKIEFIDIGAGLMVGHKNLSNGVTSAKGRLKGFEIAGKNGIWKKAGAMIISKNKIEVWNSSIEHPKYVRYAWSGNPESGNLYNKEGLPAAYFTTKK